MDVNELNSIRHNVLVRTKEDFVSEMIPCELLGQDEHEVEVLSVLFQDFALDGYDATGEYFFMPSQEDDEIQYFVNLVTLTEELNKDNLNELFAAVASINTYVLTGAFAIDAGAGTLIYKHTYEIPIEADEEALQLSVDMSMGTAMQMVSDYGYLLMEINEWKRNAQSAISLFANQE